MTNLLGLVFFFAVKCRKGCYAWLSHDKYNLGYVHISRTRVTKYLDFVVMITPMILDFNLEGFLL
jgi:hypothetical protein